MVSPLSVLEMHSRRRPMSMIASTDAPLSSGSLPTTSVLQHPIQTWRLSPSKLGEGYPSSMSVTSKVSGGKLAPGVSRITFSRSLIRVSRAETYNREAGLIHPLVNAGPPSQINNPHFRLSECTSNLQVSFFIVLQYPHTGRAPSHYQQQALNILPQAIAAKPYLSFPCPTKVTRKRNLVRHLFASRGASCRRSDRRHLAL